jgi:hypothetical protein
MCDNVNCVSYQVVSDLWQIKIGGFDLWSSDALLRDGKGIYLLFNHLG